MKGRRISSTISLIGLIALIGFSFSQNVAATVTYFAYEEQTYTWTSWGTTYWIYHSGVKLGEDVVYSPSGVGATDYGVWIRGDNYYNTKSFWKGIDTAIQVEIYARVYFRYEYLGGGTTYNWEALPLNLIYLSNDYDYNPTSSGAWQWTTSVGYKGFSFSYTTTSGNPFSSAVVTSDVSNGWRHLGYFWSQQNHDSHRFSAFLRLKVDNEIAVQYQNGVFFSGQGVWGYKYIDRIEFKFYFRYKYNWLGWQQDYHFEQIMGDGQVPSGVTGSDLPRINFIPGESGPVVYE